MLTYRVMFKSSHVKFFGHVMSSLGRGIVDGTDSFQQSEHLQRSARSERDSKIFDLLAKALPTLAEVFKVSNPATLSEDANSQHTGGFGGRVVVSGNTLAGCPTGRRHNAQVALRFGRPLRIRAITAHAFVASPTDGQIAVPVTEQAITIASCIAKHDRLLKINEPGGRVHTITDRIVTDELAVDLISPTPASLHWFVVVWCDEVDDKAQSVSDV